MYDIYRVTKVFFVFTKKLKNFKQPLYHSDRFVLLFWYQCMKLTKITSNSKTAFFPADVSIFLLSEGSVSRRLEKYVLMKGLAKIARPNMDIVDVSFFFSPGLQTRLRSML